MAEEVGLVELINSQFDRLHQTISSSNERINRLDRETVSKEEHEKSLQRILDSFKEVADETKSAMSQISILKTDVEKRIDNHETRLLNLEHTSRTTREQKQTKRQALTNTISGIVAGIASSGVLALLEWWLLYHKK